MLSNKNPISNINIFAGIIGLFYILMKYSEEYKMEMFNSIIDDIVENSVSVRSALKGRMSPSLFFDMLRDDESCAKRYARATEIRADMMAEEILDISNSIEEGTEITESENGITIKRLDMIRHRQLKIDSRKWLLAKMQPKKYGDKMDVTSDNKPINIIFERNGRTKDTNRDDI